MYNTSNKNCFFSLGLSDNSTKSDIAIIYLLTNDGKASFYGEIKLDSYDDVDKDVLDDLYNPKKYVKGLNWKISSEYENVRRELLRWIKKFYFDKHLDIQFVGDCNELEFVKLKEFIMNTKSYNEFIVPTLDNVNSGIAEMIHAFSSTDEDDGYTVLAFHTRREDFVSSMEQKFDYESDTFKEEDKQKFFNNIKRRTWLTRDIKNFIVFMSEQGKKNVARRAIRKNIMD